MRFVHIADMHFDMQFKMLSDKIGIGEQRRYDQRVILRKIINYIKENNIKYFFIAGDLYENQYIRTSTIEYINKLFLEIDDTQIFIAPGNHDPLLKNSYYNNFLWTPPVHIFGPKFERIETDNIDIYGYGFDDFYCSNLNFNDLKISNPNKINILVIHGTLDGANLEDMQYNSMSTRMLQEKGFDYVALGHIHKNNFKNDGKIIYPGSTIAMGFDELGEHGMVTGEISKLGNKLEFIKLDELEFKKQELDCTELNSIEEIIEKINSINLEENKLYEIILIGKRNFEININEIKVGYYIDTLTQEQNVISVLSNINGEELRKELIKNFTLENPIYLTVSPVGTNMKIINKNKAILTITYGDLLSDYNTDGGEFEMKVEINSNTKIECKGGINNIEQLGDVSLDIIKIRLDKNTINNEIPVATYFMSSNGD